MQHGSYLSLNYRLKIAEHTTDGRGLAQRTNGQSEGRVGRGPQSAAKGITEAGSRKSRPGVLTKELQWHNDQHEEHHYDYHRGKRFPAHYTPPHL
jgi:hypothetical protein